MVKWKAILVDYFKFSRKERLAILILCLLIVVIFVIPQFYPASPPRADGTDRLDTAWIAALKRIEQPTARKSWEPDSNDETSSYERRPGYAERPRRASFSLFAFDPNTASASDWEKLGLRPRTITTISRFLERGGKFRLPEDLGKIYGLHAGEFERLKPFVRIAGNGQKRNPSSDRSLAKYDSVQPTDRRFTKHKVVPIDINNSDSIAWDSLPGIGSKLASRILRFREKLGGFYSVDQVGETFGLADSVFQKIRDLLLAGTPRLKKININTATIEELGAHPYIRFVLAKTITGYRNQHGPFEKVESLLQVASITPVLFKRLTPYLQL